MEEKVCLKVWKNGEVDLMSDVLLLWKGTIACFEMEKTCGVNIMAVLVLWERDVMMI